MGSVEQWVPGAIQAVAAMGQLYLGIADHRLRQAEAWGNTVQKLTELEPEELRRAIEANPAAAELVGSVFEAATRTGSEDKRYILARVAAAALSGDTTPEEIDRLQFLARPVIALDPPHITLLVVIGKFATDGLMGDVPLRSVERSRPAIEWPGGGGLLDPAIAALVREGLVGESRGDEPRVALMRPPSKIELLPFGKAFLDYLLIDAGGWPPLDDTRLNDADSRHNLSASTGRSRRASWTGLRARIGAGRLIEFAHRHGIRLAAAKRPRPRPVSSFLLLNTLRQVVAPHRSADTITDIRGRAELLGHDEVGKVRGRVHPPTR